MAESLRFSIGGFRSICHTLELTDNGLWHSTMEAYAPPTERKQRLDPTPGQWVDFWQTVDQLGVWDWQKDYSTPDVCDGTSWELQLEHAGHRIKSGGNNGYPGGDGPSYSRTSSFAKFLQALKKLTGLKEFN